MFGRQHPTGHDNIQSVENFTSLALRNLPMDAVVKILNALTYIRQDEPGELSQWLLVTMTAP